LGILPIDPVSLIPEREAQMIQIKAGLQTRSTLAITALATAGLMPSAADAKTPGKTYCFHGHCHTVKTISETQALVGKTQVVKASFYDDPKNDRFNPSSINSSGVYFRSDKPDNAASPILPDGTKALVWNPRNKKTLMIRIDNAGPYWGDRTLDLSRAAAEKLGMGGVGTVHMRVVAAPTKAEATYKLGRTYAPVAGFMGIFADLDAAFTSVGKTLVAGLTPSPAAAPAPARAPVAPRVADAKVAEAKKPADEPKRAVVAEAAPKAAPVQAAKEPVAKTPAAEPVRVAAKASAAPAKIPVSQMEFLVRAAERKAERVALLVR
jgi:rare lipoprotein A